MKQTRYSNRRGAHGYVRPPTPLEHRARKSQEAVYRKHKIQACAYEISRAVESDPALLEAAVAYLKSGK